MLCKNHIHDLRGPSDRVGTECRNCHQARQVTYRNRQKLAMALLRQMEAAGIKGSDLRANDGFAVALVWCVHKRQTPQINRMKKLKC